MIIISAAGVWNPSGTSWTLIDTHQYNDESYKYRGTVAYKLNVSAGTQSVTLNTISGNSPYTAWAIGIY